MSPEGRLPTGRLRVTVVGTSGPSRAETGLARWLAGVAPRRARGTVTVALVADARVQALNRRYRHVDRVTDVLSFAMTSAGPGSRGAGRRAGKMGGLPRTAAPGAGRAGSVWLGDVVIAMGTARRQARAAGHGLADELRLLALHGLLHLLGYDHERDGGRMARLERRLRRRGGLGSGLIERTS